MEQQRSQDLPSPCQAGADPSPTQQSATRTRQLRLACARCQKRKIRCDGAFPVCRNCKKASATCVDGESLRLRSVVGDDGLVERLRKQVAGLESIIRSRLPDVDLSQDPLLSARPSQSETAVSGGGDGESTWNADKSGPWTGATLAAPTASDPANDLTPATMAEAPIAEADLAADLARGPQRRGIPRDANDSSISHEIGLVSVGTSSDPHYIGPSSGYFLARMLLSQPSKRHRSIYGRDVQSDHDGEPNSISYPFPAELVEAVQAPLPLPSREHCNQLCDVYFDVVNVQYPTLHRPSFTRTLDQLYRDQARPEPWAYFQTFMVLAIGATIQSRRLKARIPGELYCLSALQYFDRLNVQNSLPGLQCLLLLFLCTMHCPNMRLNVWYLNYQCIAAALDLGIQRNITTSSGISFLEQEMRTRLFWVVLTLDRTIATMMGRPIGLRDEACDLRPMLMNEFLKLPQDIDDYDPALAGRLSSDEPQGHHTDSAAPATTHMTFAIHLFKLAKLNSEIKYVANSVVRSAPSYAYPPVADIHEWRRGILRQLDEWASAIPEPGGDRGGQHYLRVKCQLRYHALRMLLLRPSPAIPSPSHECLRACYDSACLCIRLMNQLYRRNLLVHSWITLHTLVLTTITILYCLQRVPALAREVELDVLMSDLGAGLGILSATGEYWTSAKRCRDILDGLTRTTMSWVKNLGRAKVGRVAAAPAGEEDILGGGQDPNAAQADIPGVAEASMTGAQSGHHFSVDIDQSMPALHHRGTLPPGVMDMSPPDDLWGGPLMDQFDMANPANGDSVNIDTMMRELFEDFISNYTVFGQDQVL